MKLATTFTLLLVLAGLPVAVHGEPLPPAPPKYLPAPLLFIRFLGPPGMHVTFYQGTPAGRDFDVPVTVGLRPGAEKLGLFATVPRSQARLFSGV